MYCDNCGKPKKEFDPKTRICIHGLGETGSGIYVGGKDFVVVSPDFCSKECACEYFADAFAALKPQCESCGDPWGGGDLLCDDKRCIYVKLLNNRKRREETYKRVVERDGGLIRHVLKTCKKFYFG